MDPIKTFAASSAFQLPLPVDDSKPLEHLFGVEEWTRFFGDVGEIPPLPKNIQDILSTPCPFVREKTIGETHLLVLMPAQVNGRPFNLNRLQKLIQQPREGKARDYAEDYQTIKKDVGNLTIGSPYWLLMTSGILADSTSKDYESHCALLKSIAHTTGLSYTLPNALEAATTILSHAHRGVTSFYSETFTRCQDAIGSGYVIVGGFTGETLTINRYSFANDTVGAAGVLRL